MQLLQKNARPAAAGQRGQSSRQAPRMSVARAAAVAEKTLVTTKSDEVRWGAHHGAAAFALNRVLCAIQLANGDAHSEDPL